MVGVRFSRIAEQKSAELAESLVSRLMGSPRTIAYREMNAESLREEYRMFFVDLTEWLLYRTEADIAEKCMQLGTLRAGQGVPMEQCVNAMLTCKDHMVEFLRQAANQGDCVELFGELEFVVAVGHFFDDAIFFCMRGYQSYLVKEVA